MAKISNFKGVIPATLSVFDKNEELSVQGTKDLIRFLLGFDVGGFYLCGSTGEGPMMTPQERMREVEIVMEEVNGKVPVVVHVGAISTKLSEDLARHAQDWGATGISSVPPYYYNFSEQQIIQYYSDLAESVKIPLIAYNIPNAGLMTFDLIKKLSEIPNIVGVKFTDTRHSDILRMKEEIGKDFLVYSGCDEMAISGLIAGADGLIGSYYNCLPDMFISIEKSVREGNLSDAEEKMRQADDVINYCATTPCYFTAIREITMLMGMSENYSRRPFEPFDDKQRKEFLSGLKQVVQEKKIEAEFVKFL